MEEEIKNHEKMLKAFNMVFEETDLIKKKLIWANEHIDYINSNTRSMYVTINKLQEEVKSLKSMISNIKSDMEVLKRKM